MLNDIRMIYIMSHLPDGIVFGDKLAPIPMKTILYIFLNFIWYSKLQKCKLK